MNQGKVHLRVGRNQNATNGREKVQRGRRLQVDWARDPREGPRVLMSLRVYFEPMGLV